MANNKILDKLAKYFNIGYKKSAKKHADKIYPLKTDPKKVSDKLNKGEPLAKIRDIFPSNVQVLFDWWINDTHYSVERIKSRETLYNDCELMFMNSGIMSRAAEIYADEVDQADTGVQPIIVEGKRKQKKFILDFFDKINLYSVIRPIASSIIKKGNAGLVLSYDDTGINEVIVTSANSIKDRLEFSPSKVQELLNAKNNFLTDYKNKVHRIDQLVDMILNKDNVSSYFKKYLFGFVVDDMTLPPWRFLHFRNFTPDSPFCPFGTPIFIHSIAPYMQMDAGMTMQIAARGASFPKDVYKITMPEAMPPTEKLNAAMEFARELQNSGINAVVKEKDGVGEVIITIEGLYEYSQETSDQDLGKTGDLEMLKDDLILSTLLPRYMLDPNDGGFGDSGVALVQKWKPFARSVYRVQSQILEQITQLVKIQMIYSGKFSLDELDFILKMPYPESQTSDELIRSQSDLLGLSNDVIDSLSDKFMSGEPLPPNIIKDIYKKFLPYDDAMLDEWLKQLEKEKGEMKTEPEDEVDEKVQKIKKNKLIEKWLLVERKVGKEKLREQINDTIFDFKQVILREGSMRGYHYYSSKNVVKDFPAELLIELKIQRVVKGKDGDKTLLKEQKEQKDEMEFKPKKYKLKVKK